MKLALTTQQRLLVRLWIAAAALFAVSNPIAAQMSSRPLVHNGYSRPYLEYRPEHLPSRPPVVVMLGGTGSTAQSTAEEFGWRKQAERNGFLVVFPEPVATNPKRSTDRSNVTFWDLKGSRTHLLGNGGQPVDDDGYLVAVLRDVLRRDHPDSRRVFFAGFSSGSGMVQLFASQHSKLVTAIVAVATPLMDPPIKLEHPISILYIHGDDDEQFSGFEVNSPHFATTPHGNWVTWGYLNRCQVQIAEKTPWGVRFSWQLCRGSVPVVAEFIAGLGHEWPGSFGSSWNQTNRNKTPLDLTERAWQFFANVHPR